MFLKKRTKGSMVDMHCHVLPAVDDGSQNMEQTIEMLRIASEEGISAMIVTPHYKDGRHNASVQTILSRIAQVQEEVVRQGIFVDLYPGNEIFYFHGVEDMLDKGHILTLNNTDRVLIEFSPSSDYTYIRNALDGIRASGYVPIIAHIERYECMLRDMTRVKELKNMDIEVQVNVSSAAGKLGSRVQKYIYEMLKGRYVDYMGTDAHDSENRIPEFQECYRKLEKKFDSDYINALFYENALAIINAK